MIAMTRTGLYKTEVSRMLFNNDANRTQDVDKLIAARELGTDQQGRVLLGDVEALLHQAAASTYAPCSVGEFQSSDETAFFVPTSDPSLGAHLAISASNGRKQALRGYGKPLLKGTDVTGWWSISRANAELLIERRGLVIGVTSTFVTEAGRAVDIAHTQTIGQRRALVFEPLPIDELKALRGRVPKMNPSGRYYWI